MTDLILRDLVLANFDDALRLYQALTRDPVPPSTRKADFSAVLAHSGTTLIGAERAGRIIAMVTLHVLPNMTSRGRPYALIENVVCDPEVRRQGIGKRVLKAGVMRAQTSGCYKIMLMTGRARNVKGFYESCGFSDEDKHGLVLRF